MGKKKKPAAIIITDSKREIIRQLLSEYDIQTAQDIQEALKDLLGGTLKEMTINFTVALRKDNVLYQSRSRKCQKLFYITVYINIRFRRCTVSERVRMYYYKCVFAVFLQDRIKLVKIHIAKIQ